MRGWRREEGKWLWFDVREVGIGYILNYMVSYRKDFRFYLEA